MTKDGKWLPETLKQRLLALIEQNPDRADKSLDKQHTHKRKSTDDDKKSFIKRPDLDIEFLKSNVEHYKIAIQNALNHIYDAQNLENIQKHAGFIGIKKLYEARIQKLQFDHISFRISDIDMELVESKISAKEYKKQINTILVLTSNIGTLSKLYKDGIFLESTKTLIKCILDKTLPDSKQTSDSEMHSEITCTNEQYVISHYVDALSKIISTITDTITLSKLQSQSQLGYIQCLYQTKLEMIEFSDAKHKIKRCDFHYEEQIRKIVHNITNKKVLNMLNCDSNKFYPITYKIIVERLAELSLATEPQFQKPSTNCCYEAPTAYPESAFDDILGDKHTSSDMPPESLE